MAFWGAVQKFPAEPSKIMSQIVSTGPSPSSQKPKETRFAITNTQSYFFQTHPVRNLELAVVREVSVELCVT